ncbi:MAG: DUF190 domain-containing protein [Vulcanimicrobiaceae bacterium]
MKSEWTGKLLRIFVGERDRWKGQPLYTAIVIRPSWRCCASAAFRG